MPWSTSTRVMPKDWHKQRARCWRAAGGRCQHVTDGERCTWTGRLNGDGGQADHVHGPDDEELQWLCPAHHSAKSAAEGHQAMRVQRAKLRHPIEQHPGAR
jgi:5-methylcytosine-specific restriction protein A